MNMILVAVVGLVSLCTLNAGRIAMGQSDRGSAAWWISIGMMVLAVMNLTLLMVASYYVIEWAQTVMYTVLGVELVLMFLLQKMMNA